MKKIKQLFKGRQFTASKGIQGRYDYTTALVTGYESNGKFTFKMTIDSKRGRDETVTTDLEHLLDVMKAFAKPSEWKLVKKAG